MKISYNLLAILALVAHSVSAVPVQVGRLILLADLLE